MRLRTQVAVSTVFLLVLASTAWGSIAGAGTDASQEEALLLSYRALERAVDACPEGTCAEAGALLAEHDRLEAHRLALPPGGADPIRDAVLAELGHVALVLRGTLGEWDDEV